MLNKYFYPNGILLDVQVSNYQEIIKHMGKILVEDGIVSKEYISDVIYRENEYPTGIKLDGVNIAIPHAYPNDNVYFNRIMFAKISPITFYCMDNPDEIVKVEYVFLLALRSSNHIEVLKKMFELFQQPEILNRILNSNNKNNICFQLNEYLSK